MVYIAEVEAKGRKGPAFVVELDVPTPLLGTRALESLGLKPNPLTGELEVVGPEGGYLLSSRAGSFTAHSSLHLHDHAAYGT